MTGAIRQQMSGFAPTFRRELAAYVTTPIAYVFLAVFLLALGLFTWEAGRLFDTGVADLSPFFVWHPWLYMIFLPALAMRLWADERAAGTDELLLSLPVGLPGLVLGKLCAAWAVAGAGLVLTFPVWISINFLGAADNAAIALTYFASFLMAGAYLSIGAAVSALTSSQVTAFILSMLIAFVFTAAGWPLVLSTVQGLMGTGVAERIAQFSFITQFESAQRGVLELRVVSYFLGFTATFAFLNCLWVSRRRLG
ncbi:ABC transporter permease subunit [Hyphomonas sp.]|uniref:ABC transporter permease subunit n=1 Tax=Hyphomonas sp. TaxID=87 RepID=UPI00391D912F